MSVFEDWFDNNGETIMQRDWDDERYDIAEYSFNAGMERAAEILQEHEKLFTYNLVDKVIKAIRKEISK